MSVSLHGARYTVEVQTKHKHNPLTPKAFKGCDKASKCVDLVLAIGKTILAVNDLTKLHPSQ